MRAFVDGSSFYDVTFQAKVGGGEWTTIGTDDNEPYRVFHEVAGLAPGTTVQYRATVLDNAGHTRTSDPEQIQVAAPAVALTAPTQDGRVSGLARLTAEVTPDDNDNSVRFERSVDGGDVGDGRHRCVAAGLHASADDVSAVAPGAPVEYRAVLTYAPGKTVTSAVRAVTAVATVTTATIHYDRSDDDYVPWGLHLFGAALAPGEGTPNGRARRRSRGPTPTAPCTRSGSPTTSSRSASSSTAGRRTGTPTPRTRRLPGPLLHADRPPGDLAQGGRRDDLLLSRRRLSRGSGGGSRRR